MKAVIAALDAAPEEISPVLVIAARGGKATRRELDDAVIKMLDEEVANKRVERSLAMADTSAARVVPTGF